MVLKLVECPSPNHDPRTEGPTDILVIHYTGMRTAEEALQRLCDPEAKVSSHYTIDRNGTIYVHVPEERRARHAGVSYWAGVRDVNSRSIGIEIVNPGHEFGYVDFARPQIGALIALSRGILARHPIAPARVVGHSDVAPNRKQDPGELFPWPRLAQEGIGLWPRRPSAKPPADGLDASQLETFAAALARYGYGVPPEVDWPLRDVVAAFQRHFRLERIDGIADRECLSIIEALLAA
jgi:N-acetylmuramoyl-L-alanine amidase